VIFYLISPLAKIFILLTKTHQFGYKSIIAIPRSPVPIALKRFSFAESDTAPVGFPVSLKDHPLDRLHQTFAKRRHLRLKKALVQPNGHF
jgi:hypothetical protein